MSSLSGTGGAVYITGGRKVASSAPWSLSFRADDELAYGQVRVISEGLFLLVLAPHQDNPLAWDVMLLDDRRTAEWAWESGHIQPQTVEWLRRLPLVTP